MKSQEKVFGKMLLLLFVCSILICGILTSCTTPPIKEIPEFEEQRVTPQLEKSGLEFIGFKTDTRNLIYDQLAIAKATSSSGAFKKLGYNLEKNNFAIDKSNEYFGVYDSQEFQTYKNTERFITFVEIEDNSIKYEISGKLRTLWGSFAGIGLGTGLSFLIAGGNAQPKDSDYTTSSGSSWESQANEAAYSFHRGAANMFTTIGVISSLIGAGFLIPAMKTPKTTATFNGTYSIYVYDMLTQSVVRRDTIPFKKEAEFKGSYDANQESQDKVMEYYSKIIANEILQKYEEIVRWLKTYE